MPAKAQTAVEVQRETGGGGDGGARHSLWQQWQGSVQSHMRTGEVGREGKIRRGTQHQQSGVAGGHGPGELQ